MTSPFRPTNPFAAEPESPAVPAPTFRPTNPFANEEQAAKQEAARVRSMVNGVQHSPDQAAEAVTLSRRTGVPADVALRNLDPLRQMSSAAEFDADTFVRDTPITASWVGRNEVNAAIAKDDLESLTETEKLFGRNTGLAGFFAGASAALTGAPTAALLRRPDIRPAVEGALTTRSDRGMAIAMRGQLGQKALTNTMTEQDRIDLAAVDALLAQPQIEVDGFGALLAGTAEIIPSMGASILGGGVGSAIGAATLGTTGLVLGGPVGFVAGVTKGAAIGGGLGAFATSFSLEGGNATLDFLAMKDEQGRPMDPAVARVAGASVGLFAGSLDALSFGVAAQTLGSGFRDILAGGIARALRQEGVRQALVNGVVAWGKTVGTEVLTETAQQGVALAGEQLAREWSNLRTDTEFTDIPGGRVAKELAETAAQTFVSMALIGVPGGAMRTVADLQQINQAKQDGEVLTALAEQAGMSKLRQRDPAKYEELVRLQTPEGLERVGVDAERLTVLLQEQSIPLAQFAEIAGIAEQDVAEALARGGDVYLPMPNVLARLVGTPVFDAMKMDLKLRVDGLSQREADEQAKTIEADMAEVRTEMEAIAQNGTEDASGQRVIDDVVAQITAAVEKAPKKEQFTPENIEQTARAIAAFFITTAQRTGQDAFALYQSRGYKIVGRETAEPLYNALVEAQKLEKSGKNPERLAELRGTIAALRSQGVAQTRVVSARQARQAAIAEIESERSALMDEMEALPEGTEPSAEMLAALDAVDARLKQEKARLEFSEFNGTEFVQALTDEEIARFQTLSQKPQAKRTPEEQSEAKALRKKLTDARKAATAQRATTEALLEQAAFHGTPYTFDKFSLSAIGTGEGAQAFGWGLYFAESENVAKGYQSTLSMRQPKKVPADVRQIMDSVGATADFGSASMAVAGIMSDSTWKEYYGLTAEQSALVDAFIAMEKQPGALYRVDIPDEAVARMLDWDKPLSEQAPEVRTALATLGFVPPADAAQRLAEARATGNEIDALVEEQTQSGGVIYRELVSTIRRKMVDEKVGGLSPEARAAVAKILPLASNDAGMNQRDASLALLAAGIPGIKYLDLHSRGAADSWGVTNYAADGHVVNSFKFSTEAEANEYLTSREYKKAKKQFGFARSDIKFTPAREQTRNLVVFDENLVTITHRNGEPVTAQERTDFLAQEAMPEDEEVDAGVSAESRLQERGPVRSPRGNTYMGVIEKYTVPNPNTDAPVLKANSPLIGASTNAGNADRQSQALDALFAKHQNPLASERAWVDLANDAFSLDRIPMPPFRTLELVQQGAPAIAKEIAGLSEGMKRDAEEGLKTAQRFGKVYSEGKATPDVTAKAFLWSFLSRGVSPYVQEGAFLDAIVSDELTAIMQDAVANGWNDQLAERYAAWADSAIPEGSPGRGTQHNLNAFGKQFLRVMTQRHADAGNRTGLEIIHEMIADGTPSTQIRREFLKRGDRAGIDNKVVSFTLLLLGRTDVLVLDRVQVRNQWNDGRFDGQNIYDTELGANEKPIAGSGFAEMTFGHKGLLYYEAMERALAPLIAEAYQSLGMEGSLGRYHWDSWLLASNQEVGHASVEGLLRDAEGKEAPYVGAFVRQGKYGNYDYGFRYGVLPDGGLSTLVELLDGSGAIVVPRSVMADAKHPTRKLLSKLASAAKKRGKQYGTTEPWTAGLTPAERTQYDEGIRSAGTPAPDLWQYDPNAVGRENPTGTPDTDILFQREAGTEGVALPETIEVDGVARPTRNSTGQPIHPTEEGVRNFWRWFGDSKVVDAEGRPLVVYHGTPTGGFDTFSVERQGTKGGISRGGFSFTSNFEAAQEYASGFSDETNQIDFLIEKVNAIFSRVPFNEKTATIDGFFDMDQLPPEWSWMVVENEQELREDIIGVANDLERVGEVASAQALRRIAEERFSGQAMVYEVYLRVPPLAPTFEATPETLGTVVRDLDVREVAGRSAVVNMPGGEQVYYVADPESIKSADVNSGEFGPTANILRQGAGRPNAFIMQGVSQRTIALMNTANLSSLLHEFSHDWLEVLGDLSQGPNATEQTQADYAATLKYLGVTERSQIGVPEQEKFARSFERWLATAEAPSRGLARAFVRFKSWMQRIYRMAQEMLVPVDPEIADVFARMLATDAELVEAQARSGGTPMFTEADAEKLALSPDEMKGYAKAVLLRSAEESGRLLKSVLDDMKKEGTEQWQEEAEKVRAEVRRDLASQPVYQAFALLREVQNGQRVKLNREDFDLTFGPERWKRMPSGIFSTVAKAPFAKREGTDAEGITTVGTSADAVALAYGFRDGVALADALQTMVPLDEAVERETRAVMAQRFPDLEPMSQALADEADSVAHLENTDDVLVRELKMLGRVAGIRPPSVQAVKAVARQMLGKEQVKNIRPIVHQNAEAKAARLAGEAWKAGDAAKAAFHKRQQLLNHILYRESVKAVEQVAVIERFARKQEKAASQERLGKAGQEYLEATNAILESVEFRRVTGAVLNRRASINAFVKRSEDESGVTPAIPTSVLQDAAVINYRQLPYDQLVELHQALKQIDHIASLKNKLLKAQKQRTLEQAETAIVESIEKHHDIEVRQPDYAPNIFKRLTNQVKKWDAWHVKPEFLFRWLDGEQTFGAAHSLLFQPIADAQNDEARMLKAAVPEIKRLFALIPKDIRKTYDQKLTGPDIPLGYTREQAVVVALNWGNDSNRAALAGGFLDEAGTMPHLTPRQIQALLKTLTKAEWDFVQGVWDYIDSFWPEISSLQQRLVGVAPEKIEASPFLQTTSDGETISVRGGYYPLSYDREYSWSMRKVDAKQQVQEMAGGGFASKVTKHGHTEERVGSGGKPVDLRLSLFPSHVINVIHDLTHREAVIDVRRLMERSGVRAAINGTAGSQMYDLLNPWLNRVAAEQNGPSSPMENLLGHARVGATMVNMGFKVTTAIVQPLGYMQSVDLLGVKYARRGMQDFLKSPKQIWELVKEWSPELESRRTQFDRDVKDAVDKLGVEGWQPEVMQMAFTMTGLMDMFVAVPTFYGAYLKSMEVLDKGNHEAAVKYAESVVRQSQSAGGAKDLAMIQGGPESRRMFTMFYSYFSVLYNLFRRSGGMLAQKGVSDLPRFAGSMALLWFLPAVMGELFAQRGPEDDEDELPWLLEQIARYPFASVVGVRDVAGGIASYLTQGRMFYDISPVVSAFESTIRAGGGAIQAVAGEPMSRAELKAAVEAAGYWGKLPARQMWITGEALYDWMMGYDIAPQDLAFPRPRQ